MTDIDIKAALKEAIKEWMDDKFETFGKWSFGAVCSAGLFALIYFILTINGWKH